MSHVCPQPGQATTVKDIDSHRGSVLCLKGPQCHGVEGSLRLRAERGGGAHPGSPREGCPTAQREGLLSSGLSLWVG